jgi:hypothetical protein
MQPIVLKIANSVGFADYTEGLIPDITQVESSTNLGVLGDPTEPFLATALNQISGSAKYTIPEGDDAIHMKDPIFESTNGMHFEFPKQKIGPLFKE